MLTTQPIGFRGRLALNVAGNSNLSTQETETGLLGNTQRQPTTTLLRKKVGGRLLGKQPIFEKITEEIKATDTGTGSQQRHLPNEKLETIAQPQRLDVKPRIIGSYTPKDRTKENEWLRIHRDEYAWQWVALDGDRLVGHGYNLKEVAETAKQNGVDDALFVRVEPSDALPWAGF